MSICVMVGLYIPEDPFHIHILCTVRKNCRNGAIFQFDLILQLFDAIRMKMKMAQHVTTNSTKIGFLMFADNFNPALTKFTSRWNAVEKVQKIIPIDTHSHLLFYAQLHSAPNRKFLMHVSHSAAG